MLFRSMTLSSVKRHTLETIQAFNADSAERLAAALAYYATFSLAPLLVLALVVAGLLYGQRSVEAQADLMTQAEGLLGPDGAALLQGTLEGAAASPSASLWATILSTLLLLVGATTLVARLQEALDTIWNAKPPQSSWLGIVRNRILALILVAGAGAAIVASLIMSSLITGFADRLGPPLLVHTLERLISLAVLTLLFAILYRVLPTANVQWSDVWLGAALCAALVTLGTWAFGWYLGHASATSSYGAAGALAGFLLWVYYTAQIFFFGAE